MLDLEDFKRYQSKISPSSPPNKIKIGKKEDVKLREPPSQYFPAKHRKLQISHLLKDQKHEF